MKRHHLIISGTGRSGTTFLVQLLSELEFDTGFNNPDEFVDTNSRAGQEKDLRDPNAPYIVKSPWICDYLEDFLSSNKDVVIDHAIVPVRDLFSAAESRRLVARETQTSEPDQIWGGLWHTKDPDEQELVLTVKLYNIIYALTKNDIPVTLLYFPRLIVDPEYLFKKLSLIFNQPANIDNNPNILESSNQDKFTYPTFITAFKKISRPELVHSFLDHQNIRVNQENGPHGGLVFRLAREVERDTALRSLIHQIKERDEALQSLAARLAEREALVQSLSPRLAEQEALVQSLSAEVDRLKHELDQTKTEAVNYVLSKSWRITRPLRKIYRRINGEQNE